MYGFVCNRDCDKIKYEGGFESEDFGKGVQNYNNFLNYKYVLVLKITIWTIIYWILTLLIG